MNRKMLAVGLATLAGAAVSASARPIVYQSGFETPPYTSGSGAAGQLMPGAGATGTVAGGQDNWTYFSSSVTSDKPHVINSAAQAYQGSNYLRVNTGSDYGSSTTSRSAFMYHTDPVAPGLLAGKVLHVGWAVHTENIAGAVRISGQTLFAYSGDGVNGITGILGGMRLQSNGVFAFYASAGGPLTVNSIGAGGALNDTWYRFDMQFHWPTGQVAGSKGIINYFINGISQDAVLDGAGFDRRFTLADAAAGYYEIDLVSSRFAGAAGQPASQGNVHRWDSVQVDYDDIPAPASAALLGLGGLIAARRRRS